MIDRRALLAAALAPLAARVAGAAAAEGGDAGVLGGLLAVEEAQIALYQRATELPFHGPVAELAGRVAGEERKHAERLRQLGASSAQPAGTLHFGKRDEFLRLAQRLEGLAVGAYNGAIAAVRDPALIQALAAIAQVEARHSAAVRWLRESDPAPRALDRAFAPERAQQALNALLSG